MEMLNPIMIIIATSLVIMYACNPLEQSLNYFGRNMSGGAKGALLLAVASSLPEIMVSLAFVFSGKPELILAGVFVTAGSAIFNILLIPAVSILSARDSIGNKVKEFEIHRGVLSRDTFWLLTIEALFIYFLGLNVFTIGMALVLIAVYFLYVSHVLIDSKRHGDSVESYEYESIDHTETPLMISWIGRLFDFNKLFFGDREFTNKTASIVTLLAAIGVGLACHYLALATETLSYSLGIPVVIGAAVFAAAATSLPDTILSRKAAMNGDYEDAVGNAVGSNIFDTSFAVGLPLVIALIGGGILVGQDLSQGLTMVHEGGFMDTVRYFVWGTSAVAAVGLLISAKRVTHTTAYMLLGLYCTWLGFLAYSLI